MKPEEAIKAIREIKSLIDILGTESTIKPSLLLAIEALEQEPPVVSDEEIGYKCSARIDYSTCHIHESNEHGCIGCGNYEKTNY